MTQDDIIRMTVEASATGCADELTGDAIERFAKLVEDKTRQELREEVIYKWVPPHFVDLAVEEEREACAKICEEMRDAWVNRPVPLLGYAVEHDGAAKAIRARIK
jgi:hypothetical protein